MYINNQLMKEKIGIYRIRQFTSNTNLEYDISYLNKLIIIRRYTRLGNDTYINVLKVKCTEKQCDKISNMLTHY